MNRIAKFFMTRPVMFWSFVVLILIAGVATFMVMPKLEDPAVTVKQAMVIAPYPGADAHEVELKVAKIMEDQLRALPGVRKVETECRNGAAVMTVVFKMTVPKKDLEQRFDLLRRKVSDIAPRLPQGCYDPIVMNDLMDVYGIFYALTGKGCSYPEMYRYAKYIERELLGVNGVKRITVAGNRDEVINIVLSKDQIYRNGMLPAQVMLALQSAGGAVNAGKYSAGGYNYTLTVGNEIKDEDDVENIVITTVDGSRVRLGDIAEVKREYSEPQRNGFFVDGDPAIAVCVALEDDAVVPDVGRAVDKRLSEIMQSVPAGMHMEKIYFQPEKVSKAISSFMLNLLESVLIVVLVLVFTMGFRSGLIIGFGLVLTVAASFPILLLAGTTLHRISLGAFIIAMGMLVDNAVVIMDGILVDKKRGLPQNIYLYRIGKNTAMPLLGATIIAAATFIGVYLSPDTAGEYAKDLFLVLCVSLLASWVFALIQVPYCAKRWLPAKDKDDSRDMNKEVWNSPVHRFIRKAISSMIVYKKTTLVTGLAVLAVAAFGLSKAKSLFFPDLDYNQFIVECAYPSQTSPDKVRTDLLEMTEILSGNPEIFHVSASMGSAPARYCLVRPMTSGGDSYGELLVDCEDYSSVVKQMPKVRDELREKFPDAYIRVRKYNFTVSTSHTVEVQFTGPDPAVLKDLSRQAEYIMRECPYVDAYSVGNNWDSRGKRFVAEYIRDNAKSAGLGRNDIGNSLLAATDGMPAGVINDQERMVLVNLQVRNEDGSRIENLNEVPVWSMLNVHIPDTDIASLMTGGADFQQIKNEMFKSVPLGSIIKGVSMGDEEEIVRRVNGQRAIEAECDPDYDNRDATQAKVRASIKKQIKSIELPDGYTMKFIGDTELQNEALTNVLKYQPIALLIMIVILLLLFGSWKKVLLIILCFPFVLCGIAPTLLITGMPLTFMAIIGIVGLIGMTTKNAIVLVDEINRLQKEEGYIPYNAVVEATVSRVRPVIMASLTTIVGMIPLLWDPMYSSMAVTIMSGLAVGTITTLLLLPVFYTVFFHIKKPVENINA